VFGGRHWKIDVMKHCPDVPQHAPRQGLGVQTFPGAAIRPPVHCTPASRIHEPSVRQQAVCTVTGQPIGPHTPPGAGVVPAGHAVPMKLKHVPSAWQQATKHGFGVQPVAAGIRKPWQKTPNGITVQVPSGKQQT